MGKRLIVPLLLGVLLLAACGSDDDAESQNTTRNTTANAATPEATAAIQDEPTVSASVLDDVLAREMIRCGVQGELPGFGYIVEDNFTGLDTDFCRALAAAVLGDAAKVEFVEVSSQERFTALQERRIDVLIRNTTWTLTRDTELGLDFGPILFYDGQGVMVKRGSGIFTLDDLEGKKICVQPGTTTLPNIEEALSSLDIEYEIVLKDDLAAEVAGLDAGDCDASTTDRSALIATQAVSATPEDYFILDAVISQEPLAPAYLESDPRWGNAIRWTIYGMIHAERLGMTSENIDTFFGSGSPEIELLLGESGDMGQRLGLPNNFVVQAVQQVGSYAEIYDRNLGADSPIGLARGINALWTAGGLLYAPPFR